MSKRKYKQGDLVTSLDELSTLPVVFFHGKVVNCGWFLSWQLRWVLYRIKTGQIYKAELIGGAK